jgi:hypothetical protein
VSRRTAQALGHCEAGGKPRRLDGQAGYSAEVFNAAGNTLTSVKVLEFVR